MTFDVIPGFFLHFRIGQRITSTLGRAQKKKLEQRRQTFSMLIFLGVQTVVDVNHLLLSMLIFLLLLPHPIYNYQIAKEAEEIILSNLEKPDYKMLP